MIISLFNMFKTAMIVASLVLCCGSSRLVLIIEITSLFTANRSYTTSFFAPRKLSDPKTILCIASSCAVEMQSVLRKEWRALTRYGSQVFTILQERRRLPHTNFNFSRSTAVFVVCSQVW